MTAKTPPRALAAIAELRTAAANVRATPEPTDVDRAVVAVLDSFAKYWTLWFPAEPTSMDRAALLLARAINQAPDVAAGTQPHAPRTTERKAS